MDKMIRMADPFFDENDRKYLHEGLDQILSGRLSMGPNVAAFEKEFAESVGSKYAIALNSCTSALEISMRSLGVRPGDEVLVPVQTFIATGMAVHLVGAKPVFCEVSPDTFCLTLEEIEKRRTPKTKGIIYVYFGGMIPKEMNEVAEYCKKNGLFLIEDAAHTPGAELDGRKAGAIGDSGTFSFFPTKVITCGEGGMLTTSNPKLAETARSLQHRGRDFSVDTERYSDIGRNVRFPEFSALLGRNQLARLDKTLEIRRRISEIYRRELANNKDVRVILPENLTQSSCWKIPVLMAPEIDRDRLFTRMREKKVEVDFAYNPPLHLQPVFRKLMNTQEGDLPVSEDLLARHVCLPCHPTITDEDALRVTQTFQETIEECRKK